MKIKKTLIIIFLFTLLVSILAVPSLAAYDYYIVNETTGKYHKPSCSYLPDENNSYEISSSSSRLEKLSPCGHCKPRYIANDSNSSSSSSSSNNSNNYIVKVLLFILSKFLGLLGLATIFFALWFNFNWLENKEKYTTFFHCLICKIGLVVVMVVSVMFAIWGLITSDITVQPYFFEFLIVYFVSWIPVLTFYLATR